MEHLHKTTLSLFEILYGDDRKLPAAIQDQVKKLSPEHVSGIALKQLDTPMMKQFAAAREEVPDALLFFRMGDFFELFGADAIIVSQVCGLTLTSRDRSSDNPVPMAGVPHHSHLNCLKKCVQAGFKVAVCDQVEDPKLTKSIVKREIVRISTPAVPGDLGDDAGESAQQNCFLACALKTKNKWTIAYVDVATGEFRLTGGLSDEFLRQEILTIGAKEILTSTDQIDCLKKVTTGEFNFICRVNGVEPWIMRSEKECRNIFLEFFKESDFNRFQIAQAELGLQTVAGILSYLKATQKCVVKNITQISYYETLNHLRVDNATKKHLDFFFTSAGERKGTLFWFLNRSATHMGARALARRLNYPFLHKKDVEQEHEAVGELFADSLLRTFIRTTLSQCGDLERLMSRAAQGSLDPRGAVLIRETLKLAPQLFEKATKKPGLTFLECEAKNFQELVEFLNKALCDDPAQQFGKGRIFKEGFSSDLDETVSLEQNFDSLIAQLESDEKEKTGITTLKVGYTKVFGYYFEISKGKLNQTPAHFIRKQTLTNGERFITAELKVLEDKILNASERRCVLERGCWEVVRERILNFMEPVQMAASFIARLDLLCTFANVAYEQDWTRPVLSDSKVTALTKSVHPILKEMHASSSPFVANDISVGETSRLPAEFIPTANNAHVLLITGPNMAGKSTIMRQLAIAQLLCQMGSYVPAQAAHMGVCDKIFTRIGSGDNALRGQSTFMVEMLESAHILKSATENSLVLMDELGRGTSTFDGLSLACAILEDLNDRIRARTLFSTHYHEIVQFMETRKTVAPMQMQVIEEESGSERKIMFSYHFLTGAAAKSYGIHVAELAGHDESVLNRAEAVLKTLSDKKDQYKIVEGATALPSERKFSLPKKYSDLWDKLESREPDQLTPMQALQLVYELQNIMRRKDSVSAKQDTRPTLF